MCSGAKLRCSNAHARKWWQRTRVRHGQARSAAGDDGQDGDDDQIASEDEGRKIERVAEAQAQRERQRDHVLVKSARGYAELDPHLCDDGEGNDGQLAALSGQRDRPVIVAHDEELRKGK